MSFRWINWINMAAVVWLIVINVIVARKGLSDSFNSKHLIVNIFEQIGRYGCMALMILPVFTRDWKFGFRSVTKMLAFVPAVLFLLNGILLRQPALVAASLVFGIFHFLIVKENI